ncbi:MAG: DHH family phosphoesterase [Bacillota bacterium]
MIAVIGHNFSYTDVDSVISSIVLAEMLRWRGLDAFPALINPSAVCGAGPAILAHAGVATLPRLLSAEDLDHYDIALVDHNDPMESYGQLGVSKRPVLCIDHHMDTGLDAEKKVILKVGSTCTILTGMIRDEVIPISDALAKMLVYGIACDTKGLTSKKTSTADLQAIDYLYSHYDIDDELPVVAKRVMVSVDVKQLTIAELIHHGLKEYRDGTVGIASIEVTDDEYLKRLPEIQDAAQRVSYPLYVLAVFAHHTKTTHVLFFDRSFGCFPPEKRYDQLISRAQDLVPWIMASIEESMAGGAES